MNGGFGSLAVVQHSTIPMAASVCKPVVPQRFFEIQNLNVCFSRKRSFNLLENRCSQGQLSANSGPSLRSCRIQIQPGRCPPNPVRPLRLDAAYLQNLGQQSTGSSAASKVLRQLVVVRSSFDTPPTIRVLVIWSPANIPITPFAPVPVPDRVEEST